MRALLFLHLQLMPAHCLVHAHSRAISSSFQLQAFALTPQGRCPEPVESLARDTLALLRRRPEPDVAVAVLTEAGLLRQHEPVPLLRLGRSTEQEFDANLEQAAQVGSVQMNALVCIPNSNVLSLFAADASVGRSSQKSSVETLSCAQEQILYVMCVDSQTLLNSPPPDPDASRREDLTHLRVFTIDDASTTEVDDGLSVSEDEQGNKLFWVHVADPTRWITPGV